MERSVLEATALTERQAIDVLWVLLSAALVFLMQAGFLCLETGITRAKNNINVAIKNLTDFGVSVLLFWSVGFALMFGPTGAGLIGTSLATIDFRTVSAWFVAFFLFQAVFCGTAVTILSGAVAERMRFPAYLVAATVVSTAVYPVVGHWAWNGLDQNEALGWLARRGFTDFAGSTVVHSTGGWVSLAALLVVGARAGRFDAGGPIRIPSSNLPLATVGVVLLWLGWIGFNGGSTLALTSQVPSIIANTMLAGAAGLASSLLLGYQLHRRAVVELAMNGSLAGLVSITAGCVAVGPGAAIVIGGVGGVVMVGVSRLLEWRRIDDAVGAVPVHLGGGIWGTVAVALFGDADVLSTGLSVTSQLGVQLLGIAACFVWAFGVPYLLFHTLDRHWPFRVSAGDERVGLNVSEHHERTDLIDLLGVMAEQRHTGDLSLRAPVEPFTEVGRIASHYNDVMGALEVAQGQLTRATADKERMESELRIGREIQMSLLPLLFPVFPDRPEFSLHAVVQPAREVGGDFYDFFFIDENQLCFCIGDVSGKGVPAALFMAVSKTLIKSRASDDFSSASVLTYVNEELAADNESAMFVTVFLAVLDVKTGELVYTNGGHSPPYIRRADGTLDCLEVAHGPLVGVLEGLTYREQRVTLHPGDMMLLYTDGVTEAMDSQQQLYSTSRLLAFLEAREYHSAEDIVRSALRSVHEFVAGAEQSDDTTIMALQFLGSSAILEPAQVLEMTLRNRVTEIGHVIERFTSFAEQLRVPRNVIHKVHVIFDEVLSNVIAYAYRDEASHDIDVRVELWNDRLTVVISDDGIPFNPFRRGAPDTEQALETREEGGLGIHLIRSLMSRVSYQRRIDRNVVSLVTYLHG